MLTYADVCVRMYTGMPARDAGAAVSPCSEICASARDALARGDLELAYDCYWQASEHDAGSLGAEAGKKKNVLQNILQNITQCATDKCQMFLFASLWFNCGGGGVVRGERDRFR